MQYTGWVGTAFVFLAIYLTGNKNRLGFIAGATGEVFWLLYSFHLGIVELAILSVVFMFLYLRNFVKWGRS